MPGLDDCYPGQRSGCEWTVRYLWRWMSPFAHLDVMLLGLMLVFLFAVVIHVCCRYYSVRRPPRIESAPKKTLAAALNIELGSLKSIAITAPYLGLVGTCEGILSAFGGIGMEKHAAVAMIETRIALALIPTAVGIPIAVLATCSYNFLRQRIDSLRAEVFDEDLQRSRSLRRVSRFALPHGFSDFPAFGLSAASALVILIAAYTTLASFPTSKGLYVELASGRCESEGDDKLIVLHITDADKLFLNQEQEDWNVLGDRLSLIYSGRRYRTLYLVANSGVPFQTVAHALDIVESAPVTAAPQADGIGRDKLGIQVRLLTPKALNTDCLLQPVVIGSSHRVLRFGVHTLGPD